MIPKEIIDRLSDFSLFKDFSDDEESMKIIASIMEPREYAADEYIFRQGDHGKELYILTSGSVRVCKNTPQDEEYTITDLKAEWNIFFGEIALMDNDERSASIKVLKDCKVLVMDRDRFEELGKEHPEICLSITKVIVKIICGRLRNVNDDVILLFDALVSEIQSTQL